MLSTISSTSPLLPRNLVITATATPTDTRMAACATTSRDPGPISRSRPRRSARYTAPMSPPPMLTATIGIVRPTPTDSGNRQLHSRRPRFGWWRPITNRSYYELLGAGKCCPIDPRPASFVHRLKYPLDSRRMRAAHRVMDPRRNMPVEHPQRRTPAESDRGRTPRPGRRGQRSATARPVRSATRPATSCSASSRVPTVPLGLPSSPRTSVCTTTLSASTSRNWSTPDCWSRGPRRPRVQDARSWSTSSTRPPTVAGASPDRTSASRGGSQRSYGPAIRPSR